jgi:hypothetical protein
MIDILLGERQSTTGIASDPLAQSVMPVFLMVGQATALGDRMMLLRRDDHRIDVKLIGKHGRVTVVFRDRLPQMAGGGGAIADGIGDNLSRPLTLSRPQPAFEPLLSDIADPFIHFQHIAITMRYAAEMVQ